METPVLTPHERHLMQQGMASYLDAIMALREVQRIAEETCTRLLKSHLPGLCTAMGGHLDYSEVKPMLLPEQGALTWDGTWASIGGSLWVQDFGQLSCTLDLWRETTDPTMYATVRLTPWRRRRYTKTCELFRQHWATVPHPDALKLEEVPSDGDLLLWQCVPMGNMDIFVVAMETALVTCGALWQAVGGVATIHSPLASEEEGALDGQ